MNKSVLGIDLGTSSVKILQIYRDHSVKKYRAEYKEKNRKGWWEAILSIFDEINFATVEAIGLSSQVGTYLINDEEIIHWNQPEGKEELQEILDKYENEIFIEELGMMHPPLHSYPLPRLLYCGKKYPEIQKICQPKDEICKRLTGQRVTDPYSFRGLANKEKLEYSKYFLEQLKIKKEILPGIKEYDQIAGYTKEIALKKNKIIQGIPVYTGLNDFYASLIGMGVSDDETLFDITGTSEHIGIVTKERNQATNMMLTPYIQDYVHYGVTASSGDSLKLAGRLKEKVTMEELMYTGRGPIFLPYLNGERAPIFDPYARGCIFGIGKEGEELFPEAVMEGIVFSLYHIYENLGKPKIQRILVSGGAGEITYLNRLKAEMFGVNVEIAEETETSALGAALIAATGRGWYTDLTAARKVWCRRKSMIEPTGQWNQKMKKRYEIYKKLYPALKELYQELKEQVV